jgi:hypothetical protein
MTYVEKRSRPNVLEEPRDHCRLTPDQITLYIDDSRWYSVSFNTSTIAHLAEFVPPNAPKKAYIEHGQHGWLVTLSSQQANELSDRMEAEGGHNAWMRQRGLLR